MPVQFVVYVEACETLNFLEMVLEHLQAKIPNRLNVLMQIQLEQEAAPKRMIDDKALKRCYQVRLEIEFV